ncbi:MAG: hypothetical protein EBU31_09610 [Proteobacteria bacterium]|nr:hypothetical protein [Pseudomonadota bacterium]
MKIAFPRAHVTAIALLLLAAAPAARAMPVPMQAVPDNVYAPAAPAQATPPAVTPTPAASTPADAQTTPSLEIAVPPDRTMPVDAVLLRNGKEVPGDLRYVMLYEGTLYVFSSQGTLDLFRADPANFAAQQGGACGRMGPLGGLGDARRYAIEENMLFFFASEDCMRTFRAKPRLYMEPQDELPAGTPEQQAQGLAAVDRWIAAWSWAPRNGTSRKRSKSRGRTRCTAWTSGTRWVAPTRTCAATRSSPRRRAPPSAATPERPRCWWIRGASRSSGP